MAYTKTSSDPNRPN